MRGVVLVLNSEHEKESRGKESEMNEEMKQEELTEEEREIEKRMRLSYCDRVYKELEWTLTAIENYAKFRLKKFEEQTGAKVEFAFAHRKNEFDYPVLILEILSVQIPETVLKRKIRKAIKLRREIMQTLRREEAEEIEREEKQAEEHSEGEVG